MIKSEKYIIKCRLVEEDFTGYWSRWGKIYKSQRRAFQALNDFRNNHSYVTKNGKRYWEYKIFHYYNVSY